MKFFSLLLTPALVVSFASALLSQGAGMIVRHSAGAVDDRAQVLEALREMRDPDDVNRGGGVLAQVDPQLVADVVLEELGLDPSSSDSLRIAAQHDLSKRFVFLAAVLGKYGGRPSSRLHAQILLKLLEHGVAYRYSLEGLRAVESGGELAQFVAAGVVLQVRELFDAADRALIVAEGDDRVARLLNLLSAMEDDVGPSLVRELAEGTLSRTALSKRSRSTALSLLMGSVLDGSDAEALLGVARRHAAEYLFWSEYTRAVSREVVSCEAWAAFGASWVHGALRLEYANYVVERLGTRTLESRDLVLFLVVTQDNEPGGCVGASGGALTAFPSRCEWVARELLDSIREIASAGDDGGAVARISEHFSDRPSRVASAAQLLLDVARECR